MKVNRILMKDFLAHQSLDLTLAGAIHLFVGRNGSGKSTILDAVKVTLTGTCRDVPRKDAAELANWGADKWSTQVEVETPSMVGNIRRTATTLNSMDAEGVKHQLTQQRLDAALMPVRGILPALFDTMHAFTMTPNELRALVVQLTPSEVTAEFLAAKGLAGEPLELAMAGNWKKAETVAAQKKRDTNAALEAVPSSRPVDEQVGETGIRCSEVSDEVLDTTKERHRVLLVDAKNLEDRAAAGAGYQAGKLDQVKAELERLKPMAELDAAVAERHADAVAAAEVYDATSGGVTACAAEEASAHANLEGFELEHHQALNWKASCTCPDCGVKHNAPPMDATLVSTAKKGHAVLVDAKAKASTMLQQGRDALEDAKAKRDHHKAALADANRMRGQRQALEDKLATLAGEEPADDPAALRQEAAQLRDRAQVGKLMLDQVTAYREDLAAWEEAKGRKVKLEAAARQWEAMEHACRPDGIQAELAGGEQAGILERLGRVSQLLFADTEDIMAVTLTDDFVPVVIDRNGEQHLARTLNGSVQWRVALCLADALSHLSGTRFLVLDEVSVLDGANRGQLVGALMQLAPDYDQVLVACAIQESATGAPADSGVTVWYVQPNAVTMLADGQVEAA